MSWFRSLVAVKHGTTAAFRQWRSSCASQPVESPSAKETPGDSSLGAPKAEPHWVIVKRGRHWHIKYLDEPEFVIEDLIGMRYLAILLERPNHKFSSFELQCMRDGVASEVPPSVDNEYLDPDALRDYRRELEILRANAERASQIHDQAEVNRLGAEIKSIQAELRRGTSLNGRIRSHGPHEQARKNVQKAISRALDEIASCSPALRSHLNCIYTGADVVYQPECSVIWEISY